MDDGDDAEAGNSKGTTISKPKGRKRKRTVKDRLALNPGIDREHNKERTEKKKRQRKWEQRNGSEA